MIKWIRDITKASQSAFTSPSYVFLLIGSWLAVLTLFLLISRSSVLTYVLFSNQFDTFGKLSFVAMIYVNFFTYISSPVVFTAFLFTGLAAINISLLVYMTHVMRQRSSSRGSLGAAGAVIVSHVLSCGSSLLAPFFSAVAGSSAYSDPGRLQVATVFGVLLNIVGLTLILRSTAGVARHINEMQTDYSPTYSDYLRKAIPTARKDQWHA